MNALSRRHFLAATAGLTGTALALPALGQAAGQQLVRDVNTYLNGLQSVFAPFTQTDPQGRQSSGRFLMSKPGKLRFEYDAPNPALVVSDGSILAVFDKKSNTGPQKYPANSTPVSLLARNDVNLLNEGRWVERIESRDGQAFVTIADRNNPERGKLILRMAMNPTRLLGWQTLDQSGNRTTISLDELNRNVNLPASQFNIVQIQRQYQ